MMRKKVVDLLVKLGSNTILSEALLGSLFEIGDIHITTISNNPSNKFGGVWEPYSKGRVLAGVDTAQEEFNQVNKTGGAKTHTLKVAEIAAHQHTDIAAYAPEQSWGTGGNRILEGPGNGYKIQQQKLAGGSQPHNNLSPYITVYMWIRVA